MEFKCPHCTREIKLRVEGLEKKSGMKLEELKKFYKEIIQHWMIGGLKTVSRKDLGENFIPAFCCFAFTEAIGLYLPKLDENIENSFRVSRVGKKGTRFYRCLFRLESKEHLMECDEKIRENGIKKGIYQIRHRLAHKYLPNLVRPDIPVRVLGEQNEDHLKALKKVGLFFPIVLERNNGVIQMITVNNVKYIEELQKLVDYVYYETFVNKNISFINAMIDGHEELRRDD